MFIYIYFVVFFLFVGGVFGCVCGGIFFVEDFCFFVEDFCFFFFLFSLGNLTKSINSIQ